MNKTMLTGVCASLIFGLAACSHNEISSTSEGMSKTASATAVSQALTSGVDFNNFDFSVRPQDDFYRYVNGGWLARAEIPADQTNVSATRELRNKSRDDVKAIIDELSQAEGLAFGSDEQKVADLYRSFMDTEKLNALGLSPIQEELAQIAAIKTKNELVQYFARSLKIGVGSPLALGVEIDLKDSSRYSAYLVQSGLSLPEKDYYLNDSERFVEIRKGFVEHIAKMYRLAGFDKPQQSAETILALETELAQHQWGIVRNRDLSQAYNPYKTSDLPELAPDIDWQAYLAALGLDKQGELIVQQPSYIQGLNGVIAGNDLSRWKTYLQWKTLDRFSVFLSEDLDRQNFDFFYKTLSGQQAQEPRWKLGVGIINGILGEVIGKVYVKRHFKPEAKERMLTLVENLRAAYGDSVDELEWMTEATKAATKAKLAKFTPKIGYPDKWHDYDELTIKGDDLVGNLKRAHRLDFKQNLEKLGDDIHDWEWAMTPQTVNAYYHPLKNEIVFPAAILQPPFFNMAADDAVNYGAIGGVIGHEMGHGFDDQGAKFDGDGNMRNWWTEQDLQEFKARGQALVEQYNGYAVFDDLNVNGELTLGENIGDLSGVTIAYRAYKKSLNGKEAPVIDGLTGDERFFIGYTQVWRIKMKEEAARQQVATDPHAPGQFRSKGAIVNMPEFYRTYKVKEGDGMYLAPEKRVKIW
ncbi:M13 family peptidase [Thalassomonas viridans]|uniref:M13 family peptidase n=1 Tax=Thalassomonas viridans TaxID=137584 RepID=A0AAF0C7H0_9GAMM|nr:M13-type metalloendopeptidase [Thalassomonas viridans]WDE05292.1 M13 family peptidase [Thalassomonas viridans]